MSLRITSVQPTDLFTGPSEQPLHVVRVTVQDESSAGRETRLSVVGPAVSTPDPTVIEVSATPTTAEVSVAANLSPAERTGCRVIATSDEDTVEQEFDFVAAEPGWTMFMVSHFHYDPVWWNTQAAYTVGWDALDWPDSPRMDFQQSGFHLVRAHLDAARRDPDYAFVLAEIDYLKPYWDCHPEDREELHRLIAQGRVEIVGGTYNEPNTNLTSAESTARNAVYGMGFQQRILGANPESAWQLDVFGHDPQFPGMMADAGVTSSSWARGPFHQWGPRLAGPRSQGGDITRMQFPSEFEWVSPSGRGLLTSYMANHYSAGWWMDSAASLEEATAACYELFSDLKLVATTRNVLLPVGTDYSPPNRWVTEIARHWNARYTWPRFVCAVPQTFFAAVRAELAERGLEAPPQTRDMNPIYTGKDVSYIDTKQAQRAIENLLTDAEKFATLAALRGEPYPTAALDRAWRQMVFGAHHDGITGSESDQVYLDLLGGWREAYQLAADTHDTATAALAGEVDTRGAGTPLCVFNGLSFPRTDLVSAVVDLPDPADLMAVDDRGRATPAQVEPADSDEGPRRVTFRADDVPATGYRTYHLVRADREPGDAGWTGLAAPAIENAFFRVEADPDRGGALMSVLDRRTDRELLRPETVGNELRVYEEYPEHPVYREGPWHLVPSGPVVGSASFAGKVSAEAGPLGQRLTSTVEMDGLSLTQHITLWAELPRIDFTTRVDSYAGADRLLRVRFPLAVPGALPVSEVGNAVVGRGFALPDVDSADAPWTLDNPAYNWFALSNTARVDVRGLDGDQLARRAIGVAEVVIPDATAAGAARPLLVALAAAGVTATCSTADASRYGALELDSNLPDVRLAVGGPEDNAFTAAVLAAADTYYAEELHRQVDADGIGVVWVPAGRSLTDVWVPNADLRGVRDLPVLIVAGRADTAVGSVVDMLVGDLDDGTVEVHQQRLADGAVDELDDFTVALLNRGMPGFAVDPTGALHLSLMRSCTGWPSGVWIDPPQRTAPDGSGFQLQHWSHSFDYSLVSGAGDWRSAGLVRAGHAYNHPLTAVAQPPHEGSLPPSAALLEIDAENVICTALKPSGNPIADGTGHEQSPADGVTIRCYETHGRAAHARLRLHGGLAEPTTGDLLERAGTSLDTDDGAIRLALAPAEIATVLGRPAVEAQPGRPEPCYDVAQPAFTRYWLHNTGPAPVGGQPISVHMHPRAVHAEGPVRLRVTVASDLTEADWEGTVELGLPEGWQADPPSRVIGLRPGGHAEFEAAVSVPSTAEDGRYFVTAVMAGPDGQRHADAVTVHVGPAPDAVALASPGLSEAEREAELSATLEADFPSIDAGGSGRIEVRLRNHCRSEVTGAVQLLTPWGTWSYVEPWAAPFAVAGGGEVRAAFTMSPAPGEFPGEFWALAKVTYYGRILYTEAVRVAVTASGDRR